MPPPLLAVDACVVHHTLYMCTHLLRWILTNAHRTLPMCRLQRGLGKWVVHKFKKPVITRYLRLTVEEFYKVAGGLAAVEVWTAKKISRFHIKNGVKGGVPGKGLVCELFRYDGGINADWGRKNWRNQLAHLMPTMHPGARAVIPQVNFLKQWYDIRDINGDRNGIPWEIDVSAPVLVGASSWSGPGHAIHPYQATKDVAVTFEVPFTLLPTVTVQTHIKHERDLNSRTQNVSEAVDQFMEGFVLAVQDVTRQGFTLRVKRSDAQPWDLTKLGGMPFTVDYRARAGFPNYEDSVWRDASIHRWPTQNWTSHVIARITGELVAERTSVYTLYITGGGAARLLVNNKEVASVYHSSAIERKYNATIKHSIPTGEVRVDEARYTVKLVKGEAIKIELQSTNAGGYNGQIIKLEWSRQGVSRTLVPASALRHQPREMCLSYHGSDQMVHTQICNKSGQCSISNSYITPLLFKMACKQNLDLRCVLISDPGTLGAGAKTRLQNPE